MTDSADPAPAQPPGNHAVIFLVSLLLLFLELACIRWFPAHVLFLTFFTNTVLIACFAGMSAGCLAAGQPKSYLAWTPPLLAIAMGFAHGVEMVRERLEHMIDVGTQMSPQMVYFGTESYAHELSGVVVRMESLVALFFLMIALVFVGVGQELGRSLDAAPRRVVAYTLNIAGSVAGIVLFGLLSWLELSPVWWFLPVALGLAALMLRRGEPRSTAARAVAVVSLIALPLLASITTGAWVRNGKTIGEHHWSPYYRVDYEVASRTLTVNQVGHQAMLPCRQGKSSAPAYSLIHLLNRDVGRKPFPDVMFIGAGSGNDVSRALFFDAKHVDAVEIDPVLQRIGARDNPDRPYDDPRVTVRNDDGRHFLKSGAPGTSYDLIAYALVDSLVLHSGYSNIRLESYLFTLEAFQDAKRRLKPGGLFVTYNYYRMGWIVGRLRDTMRAAFGTEPIVLTMPQVDSIVPEARFPGFAMLIAGDDQALAPLRQAFHDRGAYRIERKGDYGPSTPDGFHAAGGPADQWLTFRPSEVVKPEEPFLVATDDWPHLYLRHPMLPDLTLRGTAIMGMLSLMLVGLGVPRGARRVGSGEAFRMFCLGAGFMLVETKAVVHMALLFGSTWIVNSVVFTAILLMILAANYAVLVLRPQRLGPWYLCLLVALFVNWAVPLDTFLVGGFGAMVFGSCLLLFAPIFFAGVVFAVSFRDTATPDQVLGANVAGSIVGGLAENTSMLLGFKHVVLVAALFYGAAALSEWLRPKVSR